MTGKHVDDRISPAARRLALLVAAIALAGVLNVSGCSNPSATMAVAAAGPSAVVATPEPPETGAGSATAVSPVARRLPRAFIGLPMGDVSEDFDHLSAVTSS